VANWHLIIKAFKKYLAETRMFLVMVTNPHCMFIANKPGTIIYYCHIRVPNIIVQIQAGRKTYW
jgi:hypothetical protein